MIGIANGHWSHDMMTTNPKPHERNLNTYGIKKLLVIDLLVHGQLTAICR